MYVKNIERCKPLHKEILEHFSEIELIELKTLYDTDIAIITAQLDEARALVRAGKNYSDPSWYSKAMQAKRFKGRSSQMIQLELTKRKSARKSKHDFTQALLNAMDIILNQEIKLRVLQLAKESCKG